jgi:8-oxo-dGTP pyrophosphatase MutT (NUDIX family)
MSEEKKYDISNLEAVLPRISDLVTRKKRCGIILITYLTKPRKFMSEGLSILLVRGRDSGIWSLPKGVINEGESEEQCAVREMFEETGIKVMLHSDSAKIDIGGNIYYFVNIIGSEMSDEDLVAFENQRLVTYDEIDKVSWVSFKDMKYIDCNKDLRILQTLKNCPIMKQYTIRKERQVDSICAVDLGKHLESLTQQ